MRRQQGLGGAPFPPIPPPAPGNPCTLIMLAAAQVACSIISAFLTAVHIFTHRFQPALHTQMAPGLGAFLVIWWICGVGAGTFKAPFKSFGNGYISEWICFFASLYYCSMAVPKCGQICCQFREGQPICAHEPTSS